MDRRRRPSGLGRAGPVRSGHMRVDPLGPEERAGVFGLDPLGFRSPSGYDAEVNSNRIR